MSERGTTYIGWLVAIIWSLSMVYDAINTAYDPPAATHAALMLVLGSIFGVRITRRDNENNP